MGLFDKLFKKLGDALSDEEPTENAPQNEKTPEKEKTPKPRKTPKKEKTTSKETVKAPKTEKSPRQKKTPKPENTNTETKKEEPAEIALESKEDLLRTILNVVGDIYDDESETANKRIVVWLDTDQITFNDYEKFKKRILQALIIDRGYKFESVNFNIGKPDESLRCTSIHPNGKEYIQIIDTKQISVSKRASISIFNNRGSLLKDEYILSPDDMKKLGISCYNIGSGERPTGYRYNHIAIDDNPDSPMNSLNKYVSRGHAHIGFSEKFGFYLQVEHGGTRLSGKRTRIYRGDKIIEVDNIEVREPLINGDLIELGKAVYLKFVELV